ncbi:MAG: non-ribosomal peptide synthetase, partial [Bryobacteraceae bacterium]
LTHASTRAMCAIPKRVFNLTEADRFLSMMPLFHLQGLGNAITQLLVGGSVICTRGFDAAKFPGWIEQFHPTWYTAGATLHRAILPVAQKHQAVLDKFPLRFVRSGGGPPPREIAEALERSLHCPVLDGYGSTEVGTGVVATSLPPGIRKPGSAGKLIEGGVEIVILDDDGRLLPPSREGQIAMRGPSVIQSYWKDPEATRNAFRGNWLLMGDLGHLDEDGYLFVTGRIKEMINRGGEKISPIEVDAALALHPDVAEAAAFAVPHPTLGEDVVAAVVLHPGAKVSETALRRFALDRIASFKIPRRIFFIDAIPKSSVGKPRRGALASLIKAQDFEAERAASPVEKKLAEIWTRVLNLDEAYVHDNFFELGGDSFALMLMMAEVETEFGVDGALFDQSDFLATPEIAVLARVIEQAGPASNRSGQRSSLVALQPKGSRIPFFCIPGADENPYYFRHLAEWLGDDQPFYAVRDPRPPGSRGVYTLEEAASRYLDAIRSMQPNGPYIVGGHCFGGIAAFEAARQLAAAGQVVRMVVLFEAPTPGYPKPLRHWTGYLRQTSAMLLGKSRIGLADARSHCKVVAELARKKAFGWKRRLLMRTRFENAIVTGEHPNTQSLRGYSPKTFAGEVVHFIAADEEHSTTILDDPRLGWREFVRGRFSVVKTPGIADGIFEPPHVRQLALKLSAAIERANASPARSSLGSFTARTS